MALQSAIYWAIIKSEITKAKAGRGGLSPPPRPYAGDQSSYTAMLLRLKSIVQDFPTIINREICRIVCALYTAVRGLAKPCAAFVVSTVHKARGGRARPTPKGGTVETNSDRGGVFQKFLKNIKPVDSFPALYNREAGKANLTRR